MALRTTIQPDQGPNFAKILKGDLQATTDGIQLVWNRLLTDAYAYARTEDPNVFHKDQELAKVRPALRLRFSGDTMIGRYFQAIAQSVYLTINADYDGVNWQRDDVAFPQWILGMNPNADRLSVSRAPAGANPSTGAIVPRFEVDATGALYERGRGAAMGAWTQYTPTWVTGGVAVTVGNGQILGHYTEVGKTVWFRIFMQVGATTVFNAAGAQVFGLPNAAVVGGIQLVVGHALLQDTGVANYFARQVILNSANDCAVFDAAGNLTTTAFPFAWGATDDMYIQGFYEKQ